MQARRSLRITGFCLAAVLATAACSSTPPRQPTPPRRDAHLVDLDRLIPADTDLVVRADLERARSQLVFEDLVAWLRAAHLSEQMLDTARPCLEKASSATLALRLGPGGFDGDVLLRMRVPSESGSDVPCGAKGWRSTGEAGGASLFEPEERDHLRTAPAMMLRDRAGMVVVATAGQIDAVLRLVRDGPDQDTIEAPSDCMIGVAARLDEAQLPRAWRDKSPTLTAVARRLSRLVLRVDVRDRVEVHAVLSYVERVDADQASRTLKRVHDALLSSEREAFKRAAESAHAEKADETVRVDLSIPRGL